MKFDRLNASIMNNRHEEPTLYMALCLIESLFADMEAETGKDLSECALGDDNVATKMRWLSRCILDVYKEQQELLSSRPRMEEAMKKLSETEKELSVFAQDAAQLEAAKAELSQLQKQLQQGEEKKEQLVFLTEEIKTAKKKVEELDQFDPEAAEQELRKLREEIGRLGTEQSARLEELAIAKAEKADVQQRVLQQTAQMEELRNAISRLTEEWQRLEVELPEAVEQRDVLNNRISQVLAKREELQTEIKRLESLLAAYDEAELLPLRKKKDALQQEQTVLDDQYRLLQQEKEALAQQRDQLIMTIGMQKAENDELSENIRSNQISVSQLEQECLQMKGRSASMLSQLSALQAEVDEMKLQKIPAAQVLVEQEQVRKEKLAEQIERLTVEKAKLEADVSLLEKKIPELDQQLPSLTHTLATTKVTYDALVAKVTAGTEELRQLEEKIKELRDRNDEEKYRIYRKQLDEDLHKLQELQAECVTVQENIQALEGEMTQKQRELARFKEQKEKYVAGCKATDVLLQELAPIANSDYAKQAEAMKKQQEMLELVRCKLAKSVQMCQTHLGKNAFEGDVSLDDCFKMTLQELRFQTEELHQALLKCANSLKMEGQ